MSPGQLDALADAVAERLAPRVTAAVLDALDAGAAREPERRLVDAATLAATLDVSAEYVREHADELGAIRLGNGPRARLRFNLDRALAACNAPAPADRPAPKPTAPRRRRRHTEAGSILRVRDAA